jgi:hypothetical protein
MSAGAPAVTGLPQQGQSPSPESSALDGVDFTFLPAAAGDLFSESSMRGEVASNLRARGIGGIRRKLLRH